MNGRCGGGGGGWKNGRTLARFQGLSCVEESQVVRNIWKDVVYIYMSIYPDELDLRFGTQVRDKGKGDQDIRNAHFTIEADNWMEIKH